MLRPYCVTPWDEDPQGSYILSLRPRGKDVLSGYRQGKEGLERGRETLVSLESDPGLFAWKARALSWATLGKR